LLNWKLLLAFFLPNFFLSTPLGSLLNKPAAFKAGLNSGFNVIKARAIPNLAASACPFLPPPAALILISYFPTPSMVLRESST